MTCITNPRQIEQFHAIFPREQLLIVTQEELLSNPNAVINAVLAHIHLPPMDVGSYSHEDIGSMFGMRLSLQCSFKTWHPCSIDDKWPTFEERTGWALDGDYPPMDAETRAVLARMFRPHNLRLYRYLERDLGWDSN